ncbi:30S ribosomal protein S17e [Candidatus Pacearchaeota archaeon]|nr:30S ribosomal protein S17e [Candidatus Pacearchaeota archaeon]
MGRIKSLMIKRAGKQLLVADNERFNENFQDNKVALGKNNLPSKSTRNKIAGYIARKKMAEKYPRIKKVKVEEVPVEDYRY